MKSRPNPRDFSEDFSSENNRWDTRRWMKRLKYENNDKRAIFTIILFLNKK